MSRAKESLQSLNNVKGFETIWKIIQKRWNSKLHPLYLASRFLNPQFHYYNTFKLSSEYKDSFHYIKRMVIDHDYNLDMTIENQLKVIHQLDDFSSLKGLFGSQDAISMIHTKDPVEWWDSYGNDCPELQRIAIRLLSLTCSSCGSGQIRNAYEQVYPKKRSHLKSLNDLFVVIQDFKSYAQLHARTKTLFEDIRPEALSSVTENEVGKVSGAKKDILVNVDVVVTEEIRNYSGNKV